MGIKIGKPLKNESNRWIVWIRPSELFFVDRCEAYYLLVVVFLLCCVE
jgi:hypothetical protein